MNETNTKLKLKQYANPRRNFQDSLSPEIKLLQPVQLRNSVEAFSQILSSRKL